MTALIFQLRLGLAALLVAVASAPARAGSPVACLRTDRGPCAIPDSLNVLLDPRSGAPTLVANFGIIYPDGRAGFEFVCEENFGRSLSERMQIDATGRVFVPALDGLYLSSDGCGWSTAAGSLGKEIVFDLAFDPSAPSRVWAISGVTQRKLHLSEDGGRTFTIKATFPESQLMVRVLVAPSDPRVIYVAGFATRMPLLLAASEDGGESFIMVPAPPTLGAAALTVEMMAVAPDDPRTIYFAVAGQQGDEIWKSSDGGRTAMRRLSLLDGEFKAGFAFGDTPETIYVAGRPLFSEEGKPTGRLYISTDGANSWRPPVVSGDKGPRFRCLAYRDGKLFACGAGETDGDEFLLGASGDEGQTWTPLVRVDQLSGARTCAAASCVTTAVWLCESHGICGPGADAGAEQPRDAGVDGPIEPAKGDGCGCALGAARPAAPGLFIVLGVALWLRRRRR